MEHKTKLFSEERKKLILDLLSKKKRVTVQEFKEYLNISIPTINKYLKELDDAQKLIKTHGGALDWMSYNDIRYPSKSHYKNMEEKIAIAKEAKKLVKENNFLYINGGTTTTELAIALSGMKKLRVITASINIIDEFLSNGNIDLKVIGGDLRPETFNICGFESVNFIKNYFVDIAFLGTDGVSLEMGITTPNFLEAELDREILKRTNVSVVLADHSKFGKSVGSKLIDLKFVNYIITDEKADDLLISEIEKLGPKVIKAPL